MLNDIFNKKKADEWQNIDTTNTVRAMSFFD